MVNSLTTMCLHPTYTIPIMGCFRPIAKRILNRVVELLKQVPNLSFNCSGGVINNFMEERFFIDCVEVDDVVHQFGVIEAYLKHQRFLDLHELACLAFCRMLELAPFLKRYVIFFSRALYYICNICPFYVRALLLFQCRGMLL